MGKGDFDSPVTLSAKDELGDLARSLNAMAQNLKESELNLLAANEHLKTEIQEKNKMAKELGAALLKHMKAMVIKGVQGC
nr:HAMP domain-containing protein [uncultured Desulfobacter sp.]